LPHRLVLLQPQHSLLLVVLSLVPLVLLVPLPLLHGLLLPLGILQALLQLQLLLQASQLLITSLLALQTSLGPPQSLLRLVPKRHQRTLLLVARKTMLSLLLVLVLQQHRSLLARRLPEAMISRMQQAPLPLLRVQSS
jgi:hypothetical protein